MPIRTPSGAAASLLSDMWVSRREIARLERELLAALRRADQAEERLQAERQSKDWLTLQLASRVVTKHGQYGLEHTAPQAIEAEPPKQHPQGFTHEPTELDNARLEFYKQNARAADRSEEEAQAVWEAEMRGEQVEYAYEQEQ